MSLSVRYAFKARRAYSSLFTQPVFSCSRLTFLSYSGFFRRNKSTIISSSTPIIIDKHELHSTWPVFQQHEARHLTQDAVVLTVDRSQNCYGPGDRVSVHATIHSNSTNSTILRGYEFTLKETTIFRAGPHVPGKAGAPQVKINIIGEQKVPVNMTMHSGQVHRSELAVTVPQTHTTTTLTYARHIDITYILVVKALMGTGKPLIMELPVIVSNWPR
jgi:Arrestin (or S-antigen), C-terminal domain